MPRSRTYRSDPIRTRFPTEVDNLMLTAEDLTLWLGISRPALMSMVRDGRFPPPVSLSMAPKVIRTTPVRWFRFEIEDWLYSRPRLGENIGYLESLVTPERVQEVRKSLATADLLLKIEDVCYWLGVTRTTVYRYIQRDIAQFPRPISLEPRGRSSSSALRFRRSEIEAWLAALPRRISSTSGVRKRKSDDQQAPASGAAGVRKDTHADRNGEVPA